MLKILENKEKLQEKVNKEGPNMIVKIVTKDRQNQCGNTSKQRRSKHDS